MLSAHRLQYSPISAFRWLNTRHLRSRLQPEVLHSPTIGSLYAMTRQAVAVVQQSSPAVPS